MTDLRTAAQQALTSETNPPADECAQTDARRVEQRRRLDELLNGRKRLPLRWNEFGNYLITEDV